MAQAMIGGVLRKGLLPKNEIIATAATQKTIDTVAAQYGVNVTLDNKEAAKADIIVLAVKPVYYAEVIAKMLCLRNRLLLRLQQANPLPG